MIDLGFDPREWAGFWGLCGGMLGGLVGLVTAYSARAGNPLARRKAWLNLGLGVVGGTIIAEALTSSFVALIPALDSRGLPLFLGWIAANDPRSLFDAIKRMFFAALPRSEP